jgi:putative ABC transport system permease protein
MLIAGLGAALGLLLALWATELIVSLGRQLLPSLNRIEIEWPVLLFTLAVSALAGIFFGLAPAVQLSRPSLSQALNESGRGSGSPTGQRRLRNGLIVAEITLAVVLLVSAGLLIRSIIHLQQASPGFNPENLLTMNVWLPRVKYPDAPKWNAFYDQISQRIRALPGVQGVGLTSVLPISSNFDRRGFQVETHPAPRGAEPEADTYFVTPGYLQTMQIPLLKGRALTEQDTDKTEPVALVSETLARRYWPGEEAIGKRLKFPGSESRPQPWRTVVGLTPDVKQYGVDKEATMQLYLPAAQFPSSTLTLVVRTSNDPAQMLGAVRNEIRAVDPNQAVFEVATMEELLSAAIAQRRFVMFLLAVFAGLALALAAIGIYGVMSYTVTQRTRELGIRLALGAQPAALLRLVIGQGMRLALFGIGLGLLAAAALTRLLQTLLFEVSATDWVTFTAITLLLGLVALLACWIPARRAAKVDPMIALRCE